MRRCGRLDRRLPSPTSVLDRPLLEDHRSCHKWLCEERKRESMSAAALVDGRRRQQLTRSPKLQGAVPRGARQVARPSAKKEEASRDTICTLPNPKVSARFLSSSDARDYLTRSRRRRRSRRRKDQRDRKVRSLRMGALVLPESDCEYLTDAEVLVKSLV